MAQPPPVWAAARRAPWIWCSPAFPDTCIAASINRISPAAPIGFAPKHPPDGFTGITEGSWFGSYKVDNNEVWKSVVDGTFQGYSVEGMFDMEIQDVSIEQEIVDMIDDISKL